MQGSKLDFILVGFFQPWIFCDSTFLLRFIHLVCEPLGCTLLIFIVCSAAARVGTSLPASYCTWKLRWPLNPRSLGISGPSSTLRLMIELLTLTQSSGSELHLFIAHFQMSSKCKDHPLGCHQWLLSYHSFFRDLHTLPPTCSHLPLWFCETKRMPE